MAKTTNPNFFCGFFCIGQRQKRNDGDEIVDAHRVKMLESDTKMIRGCPIFSVSGVDDDGGVGINCAKLTNSQRLFPYCQMQ
jgi:hypothetical protein